MDAAPEAWLRTTLGQIGDWSGGGTPAKSHAAYWASGGVPWVSPKDMKQPWIHTATDRVTDQAIEETGLKLVPPGSLLFVTRSGILAHSLPIAVNSVPVVINQDLKALTPYGEVDSRFVQFQLGYLQSQLLQSTVRTGTTVQSVNFEALKNFEIVLPPLGEQKRITERLNAIFTSTASARAQLLSIYGMLESFRKSLVVKTLSGQLIPTMGTEQKAIVFRDVDLSEIAEIRAGVTLGKKYGASELVSRPYLRVANVQRGRLDLSDIRTIQVTEADAERYKLLPGDILMNEGGDRDKLGRGWVWHGEISNCIHQNHVFRLRLYDSTFPPEYVSLYANEIGRSHFLNHGTQTTNLASISKARLGKLPLRLPSVEDARAILGMIANRTRWIDGLRYQLDSALASLDTLEKASVRKAIEGRLALSASDELKPSLQTSEIENLPKRLPRKRNARLGRATTMQSMIKALEQWPAEGITFEALRSQIPSDYETLKDALFDLLSGANPKLEQKYDDKNEIMRFYRREQ